MVNINELNGIDFSNRYYDPTQPFMIENEFHRFYSEPYNGWGLKYEFQSDYYNTEVSTSSLSVYEAYVESFNNMLINEFRVNLIEDLFSDYDDINFIDLFFDFNELPYEMRHLNYYHDEDYSSIISYYESVLEKYGISCNEEDLDYLAFLINSSGFSLTN